MLLCKFPFKLKALVTGRKKNVKRVDTLRNNLDLSFSNSGIECLFWGNLFVFQIKTRYTDILPTGILRPGLVHVAKKMENKTQCTLKNKQASTSIAT